MCFAQGEHTARPLPGATTKNTISVASDPHAHRMDLQ
jgi:hypothetical protein